MSTDNNTPLIISLAVVGGTGFIFMMVALGIGAAMGESATGVGTLFSAGVALLLLGIIGWAGLTQPHKHFDDINEPHYTGHHEEH